MNSSSIILAVVVTDRFVEFDRLLRSLDPVRSDSNLHIVALDNGHSFDGRIRDRLTKAALQSTGMRCAFQSKTPCSPLHIARQELSEAVATLAAHGHCPPLIWMLDDDLTFEEVRCERQRFVVRNVSEDRIKAIRAIFRDHTDIDILVSGFTGDPPIRPEAVLASQLGDLAAALKNAEYLNHAEYWPEYAAPKRWQDDYYDYSVGREAINHANPVAWLSREIVPNTVTAQLERLLFDAASISRGCTPFRPLLGTPSGPPMRVPRSNRGGNTIFRGLGPLLAHQYPAFQIGDSYSRRADMVGLDLLLASKKLVLAEGFLTLRHDRSLQSRVTGEPERLLPEFAGVLLSRAVSHARSTNVTRSWLTSVANERVGRILGALEEALVACRRARLAIERCQSTWRQVPSLADAAAALALDLDRTQGVLMALCGSPLREMLLSPEIQDTVLATIDTFKVGANR